MPQRVARLIVFAFAGVSTCLYRNESDRMLILRCFGPEPYFLEKVIFPFETWCFETPGPCEVELWSHALGGPELVDRFSSTALEIGSAAGEPNTAMELVPVG